MFIIIFKKIQFSGMLSISQNFLLLFTYFQFHDYFFQGWQAKYVKYDLMRDYFLSIPIEEQDVIWAEVGPALENREIDIKRLAAKKALAKSTQSKRNK